MLFNLVIFDLFGNLVVMDIDNYRFFIIYYFKNFKVLDGFVIVSYLFYFYMGMNLLVFYIYM